DIALEQEKKRRQLAQQKEADAKKALEKDLKLKEDQAKRLAADEAKKLEVQKLAKQQENEKLAQAAAEKERQANIQRITGMAGANGAATDTGTAQRTTGASASYGGKLRAAIRPNVVFTEEIIGNPIATVRVRVMSDGTITSQQLLKSSGDKNWDDAAINAIIRTRVLPRDVDGRIPYTFIDIVMGAREQ
ncbi:MAG: cell envelope integrity protein TolA, partial [Polaromonas sp.]|nr:cell envelope integrity protein TolA [Polaromonas sp.]